MQAKTHGSVISDLPMAGEESHAAIAKCRSQTDSGLRTIMVDSSGTSPLAAFILIEAEGLGMIENTRIWFSNRVIRSAASQYIN